MHGEQFCFNPAPIQTIWSSSFKQKFVSECAFDGYCSGQSENQSATSWCTGQWCRAESGSNCLYKQPGYSYLCLVWLCHLPIWKQTAEMPSLFVDNSRHLPSHTASYCRGSRLWNLKPRKFLKPRFGPDLQILVPMKMTNHLPQRLYDSWPLCIEEEMHGCTGN